MIQQLCFLVFNQRSRTLRSTQDLLKNITEAPLIFAQIWKQPTCPSESEWINKLWSIQIMAYYSALSTNEISSHENAWKNTKCIL